MKKIKMNDKILVDHLVDKYGNIKSITNIQLRNGRYDITADTEKGSTVYFSTGGKDEDYKYSCGSHDWGEHVCHGLTLGDFHETSFKIPIIDVSERSLKPHGIRAKQMYKRYGTLLSIKIIDQWKYHVDGEITVSKRDKPVPIRLSRWYDEYLNIDTYKLSWDDLMGEDQPPYILENDESDESGESGSEGGSCEN